MVICIETSAQSNLKASMYIIQVNLTTHQRTKVNNLPEYPTLLQPHCIYYAQIRNTKNEKPIWRIL